MLLAVYAAVSWCLDRLQASPRRAIGAGLVFYAVVLAAALGSGLTSTESTPSPPPVRLIAMQTDAGAQVEAAEMRAVDDPIPAVTPDAATMPAPSATASRDAAEPAPTDPAGSAPQAAPGADSPPAPDVAPQAAPGADAPTTSDAPAADPVPLQTLLPKPDILIESTAAYVYDQTCGRPLYGKNEDRELAPASLTKMMTALVAVEHTPDLERVVVSGTSAKDLKRRTGSSVMGLEPGMKLTMRDLLYGLMLPSGNDAAIEIARAVAGNEAAFSTLMNEKAAQLGLTGTRFDNPHGLDSDGLRSTAHDLVVLGEAMMADPLLADIARAANYTVGNIALKNGNKMIASYPGTYGVKIGYTGDADHTIVVAAERDGHRIYASVLGSEVPYVDATALLDWAFGPGRLAC